MKISEAAERAGLNISSVRFYERKGLLTPQRERENRYRDYTEEDVQRIKQILLYRKMGISVDVIELLLNGRVRLSDILEKQKKELESQMQELKGAAELCNLVILDGQIPEGKKLEGYLNYVHQEEEGGKRFPEAKELLEGIAEYSVQSIFPGVFCMGAKEWLVGAGIIGVWVLMAVIFASRVISLCQDINSASVSSAVIWGMIVFCYAIGCVEYLKNRRH